MVVPSGCVVDCNHQLGLVGSVVEYPHETGTDFPVGSRKNDRKIGGDKGDFSFWFRPRYSAIISVPIRVEIFTR